MSIILSEDLKLALKTAGTANNPVILYDNLVTATNVTADSEEENYPASNLANPSTTPQQGWRSASTAVQYVTIDLATTAETDAIAFARHNFGSTGIIVSAEGTTDGDTWTEIVDEFIPASDDPLLMRYARQGLLQVRAKLQPNGAAPRASVMSAGTLLLFEQGVEIGDVPLRFGRQRDIVTGLSQSGDFLGRIITGGTRRSRVSIRFIDPEWFRANVDDFLDAGIGTAFFYVAEPDRRPNEVGYVWLTSEPNPPVAYGGGALDLNLDIEGIL